MLVYDSIQGRGLAATATQRYRSLYKFNDLAKNSGLCTLLIGHITKRGQIAGPKDLEHNIDAMIYLRLLVSTGLKGSHFRRFTGIQSRQGAPSRQDSARRLNRRSLWLPSSSARLSLAQNKQLPSGAPNRRANVETRRTRWLSRVNPMAGSWSLRSVPEIQSAGELRRIATNIFPAFRGRSMSRNWRFCDCRQMIVKQQEKIVAGRITRLSANITPSGAVMTLDGSCVPTRAGARHFRRQLRQVARQRVAPLDGRCQRGGARLAVGPSSPPHASAP